MNNVEMVATEKVRQFQRTVKKELAHLNSALMDGETVVNMAIGDYRDRLGKGLLVLTDRRVLFIESSGVLSSKMNVEDFPLRQVTSVATQRGQVSGTIVVHVAGNKAEIHKVMPIERTDEIASYIRDRISADGTVAPSPAPAQPDVLAQLKQLGELKDAGILTEDEFNAKKADLLARM